jgi:TetR/AcrR family transcriptional regulator, regulator of biofilm formation and stress response
VLAVPIRPETHRARGHQRRETLLRAAVEVAAERGIAGTTHRAVAARAGVPSATTSYFFPSIAALIQEALQAFVTEQVEQLDGLAASIAERGASPDEVADLFAATLVGAPVKHDIAQFEIYLEAARNPEMREAVADALAAFERLAATALKAAGAKRPAEGARAFVALADGFALHRLARPRGEEDVAALREGLRSLAIAYAMEDDERAAWDERLTAAGDAT